MKEQPDFNVDAFLAETLKNREQILPKNKKDNSESGINENSPKKAESLGCGMENKKTKKKTSKRPNKKNGDEISASDRAELVMESLLDSCEIDTNDKIEELGKILEEHPDLAYVTNQKIGSLLKDFNYKISRHSEYDPSEASVFLTKYEALKKIREYFFNE